MSLPSPSKQEQNMIGLLNTEEKYNIPNEENINNNNNHGSFLPPTHGDGNSAVVDGSMSSVSVPTQPVMSREIIIDGFMEFTVPKAMKPGKKIIMKLGNGSGRKLSLVISESMKPGNKVQIKYWYKKSIHCQDEYPVHYQVVPAIKDEVDLERGALQAIFGEDW